MQIASAYFCTYSVLNSEIFMWGLNFFKYGLIVVYMIKWCRTCRQRLAIPGCHCRGPDTRDYKIRMLKKKKKKRKKVEDLPSDSEVLSMRTCVQRLKVVPDTVLRALWLRIFALLQCAASTKLGEKGGFLKIFFLKIGGLLKMILQVFNSTKI